MLKQFKLKPNVNKYFQRKLKVSNMPLRVENSLKCTSNSLGI